MTITFSQLGMYGRLGNQLWQVASTIGIALKNGHDFVFPMWRHDKEFDHSLPMDYLEKHKVYEEPTPHFHDIYLDKKYDWDLKGYFQSWKYFQECEGVIHYYLSFQKPLYNGVAVHVRRGDYINLQHIHPVQTIDYYKSAMDYFKGEQFTFFSDDINWCIENFSGLNTNFQPTDLINPFNDFRLMSGYKNFIISNSSYSWWAAYLSKSEHIIAPKVWVSGESKDDRVPSNWIRM